MRAAYENYIAHPEKVEALLLAGAQKARAIATPFMAQLRAAVGLRALSAKVKTDGGKAPKTALASFKQYREKDGQFYFKLVDAAGSVLLQSRGFESPKVAGQAIAQLQREGASGISALGSQIETMGVTAQANAVVALGALAAAAEQK